MLRIGGTQSPAAFVQLALNCGTIVAQGDIMTYELWVGRTLYLSTRSNKKAFGMYRRFRNNGQNVQMKFVRDLEEVAA